MWYPRIGWRRLFYTVPLPYLSCASESRRSAGILVENSDMFVRGIFRYHYHVSNLFHNESVGRKISLVSDIIFMLVANIVLYLFLHSRRTRLVTFGPIGKGVDNLSTPS
jgi:hypothetical protein